MPVSFPSKAYLNALPKFVEQITQQHPNPQTIYEPIYLQCQIYDHKEGWFERLLEDESLPAEPKGCDVDNRANSIMDILTTAGHIQDDVIVMRLNIEKYPGLRVPGTDSFGAIVRVYEAKGWERLYS